MINIKTKLIVLSLLVCSSLSLSPVYAAGDLEKPNLSATKLETPELPEVDDLQPYSLPDNGYVAPDNMPDINGSVSSKSKSATKKLNKAGTLSVGENNYEDGIGDLPDLTTKSTAQDVFKSKFTDSAIADANKANATYSGLGKSNWNEDTFNNYISNVQSEYLPQLQKGAAESKSVNYDPIDLSSSWSLTSFDKAKELGSNLEDYATEKEKLQSSKATLPDYNTLMKNLQSSQKSLPSYSAMVSQLQATKRVLPSVSLPSGGGSGSGRTSSAQYNAIRDKVIQGQMYNGSQAYRLNGFNEGMSADENGVQDTYHADIIDSAEDGIVSIVPEGVKNTMTEGFQADIDAFKTVGGGISDFFGKFSLSPTKTFDNLFDNCLSADDRARGLTISQAIDEELHGGN